MKLDYLKEKKELVSFVLLGVSALLAVLIFVKVTGFLANSARAEGLVEKAVAQNNADANDVDKYFTKYKALANVLKTNNLFSPQAEKQHPVKEVWGILGDEALIKDKSYKVGDKIGDATIVAIEATKVTIEWDGKEKTFAPIDAADAPQPSGSRPSGTVASSGAPGARAEMVAVGSQQRPMGRPGGPGGPGGFRGGGGGGGFSGMSGMMGRFQNMSESERDRARAEMRDRFQNMSEAERERFRADMRARFSGGGSGPSGGGRSSGGGRPSGGGDRRGGR